MNNGHRCMTAKKCAARSLLLTLFCLTLLPLAVAAADRIILNVSLNGVAKGDLFVFRDSAGDVYIRCDDLKALGVSAPNARTLRIDGEEYCSLRSIEGLSYQYDEKRQTLSLTTAPALLSSTSIIDLRPKRAEGVYYPLEQSAFLNYSVQYSHADQPGTQDVLTVANKLGLRSANLLFLSDSVYTRSQDRDAWVRLMSNIAYEDRQDLRQYLAGDTFATSGELGSAINIGGISVAKQYTMDPFLIKQPLLGISGVTALPSDAEIYLDGMLMGRTKLMPGAFSLENIYYYGGARTVEVVVRDAFGNEQRIVRPFYFTDLLLDTGLHEYQYAAGFLRRNFGVQSNDYGDAAFSAFHRYGVNNHLTVGARAEGTKDLVNFGADVGFSLPRLGVTTISLSESQKKKEDTGYAGSITYGLQVGRVSTRLFFREFSDSYETITGGAASRQYKSAAGIGGGYSYPTMGSISLDIIESRTYAGDRVRTTTAGYTYSHVGKVLANFFLTVSNIRDSDSRYEVLIGVQVYPWKNRPDTFIAAQYQKSGDTNVESVTAQKTPPAVGEGAGYRASLETRDDGRSSTQMFNPSVQYRARYGIYSADARAQYSRGDTSEQYSLSAAGALVYADRTFGLTRPINDSFGIVRVGDLADVPVTLNSTAVGRTDASGTLVIPELKSYVPNQIAIDGRQLPENYRLSTTQVLVSPSIWSGSCLTLEAAKFQAVTGMLVLPADGTTRPLEYRDVLVAIDGRTIKFPTGKGGEFYFENVLPLTRKGTGQLGCDAFGEACTSPETFTFKGSYRATFAENGRTGTCIINVPRSDDIIIDVGTVVCAYDEMPSPPPKAESAPPAPAGPPAIPAAPPATASR